MAYEEKEGQGKLFRNNKDGGNPNWPDYGGDATINGVKVKISGWVRTPRNGGNKYLSLSFQPDDRQDAPPKEQTQNTAYVQPTQPAQQAPPKAGREEDDLPF